MNDPIAYFALLIIVVGISSLWLPFVALMRILERHIARRGKE